MAIKILKKDFEWMFTNRRTIYFQCMSELIVLYHVMRHLGNKALTMNLNTMVVST